MYLSSPSMLSKNYSFFQPTNIYGLEKKGGDEVFFTLCLESDSAMVEDYLADTLRVSPGLLRGH